MKVQGGAKQGVQGSMDSGDFGDFVLGSHARQDQSLP
jgi:hypothetical protein